MTDLIHKECQKGLRDTAQRLKSERSTDMMGFLRTILGEYVWAPILSVLRQLWLKALLVGPFAVWLFQIGWGVEAQSQALELMRIRWAGHLLISIFVFIDMITRTIAAIGDPEDTVDVLEWRTSFGKLVTYNLLTWGLGVLANYGAVVNLTWANSASLTILVVWVGAIVFTEFWSAARNVGLLRIISGAIKLYRIGSGKEEVTQENVEDVAGDGIPSSESEPSPS